MSSICELGNDAKIGPGTADSPEEVRVLLFGSGDDFAVRDSDACAEEIVDGEAVHAGEPADAAAESEAADTWHFSLDDLVHVYKGKGEYVPVSLKAPKTTDKPCASAGCSTSAATHPPCAVTVFDALSTVTFLIFCKSVIGLEVSIKCPCELIPIERLGMLTNY